MHRSCRLGVNAWQQFISGARRSARRRATVDGSAATHEGQARFFASGDSQQREPREVGTEEDGDRGLRSPTGEPAQDGRTWTTEDRPRRQGRRIIFSGIQPTGVPHLGNYLGALREWKRLQDSSDPSDTTLFFCVVDMHALTVPRPAEELLRHRREMMAALLAVGLDPDRATIYFQSSVPEHFELQWILSCTASTGYLSRMTQWKSKLQLSEDASLEDREARKALKHGLFSYPILQAADILVHRATHVPVGEDQSQHLEFARECAGNFNSTYRTRTLVAPETLLARGARRLMSLADPLKKMSKSDPSANSRVLLTDSDEEIRKKINRALTDSRGTVSWSPHDRPGVANLLEMLSALDPAGRTAEQLGREMEGEKVAELKRLLARRVVEEVSPLRERFARNMARPGFLEEMDAAAAERARRSADETMREVRAAVGLRKPDGKLESI